MPRCIPTLDSAGIAAIAALGPDIVVLDTNVLAEIVSVDLVGKSDGYATPAELRRSPEFRCRQLRARYSNLLGWHLAAHGRSSLSLQDETVKVLTEHVAPRDGGAADVLTRVIVHHVMDAVFSRWQRKFIRDDELSPQGTDADRWLVDLASRVGAPLITNEGVSPDGIHDRNGRGKNLRARAREAGVPVFAPSEYLRAENIDVQAQAVVFVEAVTDCLRSAVQRRAIPGPGARVAAERLADLYRFVMLDEVADDIAAISPPVIPWAT